MTQEVMAESMGYTQIKVVDGRYCYENTENRHIDFGVTDAKGRQMGATIKRYEVEMIPSREGFGHRLEAGRYFVFSPHAARNGENYGASQSRQFFKDEDARADAIEKYLSGAHKRAIAKARGQS